MTLTPQALQLITELVLAAAHGVAGAADRMSKLEGIVAEGRDPTPQEWTDLKAGTDAVHQDVQAL